MRPTGGCTLGIIWASQNWVRLQNDPAYECFYFIADWHALTSDYADTSAMARIRCKIMMIILRRAGSGEERDFQQSAVPEHAELAFVVVDGDALGAGARCRLIRRRWRTLRTRTAQLRVPGYPVLQTADIVIYSKEGASLYVRVGEDQVSHVN